MAATRVSGRGAGAVPGPADSAVAHPYPVDLATIYHPLLNTFFKTQPLTATELAICIALASIVFVAVEIEKWFGRRARRRMQPP